MSQQLLERLAADGWSVQHLALGPTRWASATKFYPTVGGGRDAVLYFLADGSLQGGEFESEGQNALATCDEFERARLGDDAFVREVGRRIDSTYGRRLLPVVAAAPGGA